MIHKSCKEYVLDIYSNDDETQLLNDKNERKQEITNHMNYYYQRNILNGKAAIEDHKKLVEKRQNYRKNIEDSLTTAENLKFNIEDDYKNSRIEIQEYQKYRNILIDRIKAEQNKLKDHESVQETEGNLKLTLKKSRNCFTN